MWVKSDEELHRLEERWREHRGEAVGSSQPVLPQIGNSQDTDKLPDKQGGVSGNFISKGSKGR